jgi:glycosyltransferase involved in cell wall biosynthesis
VRVLLVHNRYRSGSPDGEEVVFRSEASLLDRAGHQVESYTRSNDEFVENRWASRLSVASQLYRSDKTRRELSEVIRAFKPDVVHLHNLFPLITPSAIDMCRERDIPVVQTLHNFRLACMAGSFHRPLVGPCRDCSPGRPWAGVRRRCYRGSFAGSLAVGVSSALNWWSGIYRDGVQHFFVLTSFAREQLMNFGVAANKISIKPNFVEAPSDQSRANAGYGVFSGRLASEKGVDTLLAAWRSLSNVPLKILGEGPERPHLELVAHQNDLPIDFLGHLQRTSALDYIRRARFLVVTSDCFEGGVPLVAIEAWAAGVPVITPDHGAFAELQPDVEVLKFRRGDAAALCQAIRRLLADDALGRALVRGGLERFKRLHTAERSLEALETTYAAVIAAGVRR